jgi:predicted amidohydrolase
MNTALSFSRRQLLQGVSAGVGLLVGRQRNVWLLGDEPRGAAAAPLRITLAQVASTEDVPHNLATAQKVFEQAKNDKAGWILFPELFLTGTYNGNRFSQKPVASAFDVIAKLCAQARVVGLIGTGWTEADKTYNQVRVVNAKGILVGAYAKTCLTYGDATEFSPGPLQLTHAVGGVRFGTLICNDLWVTPGFSDGPNPHLARQQARAGAAVIFHAVGSGNTQQHRKYHESTQTAHAIEAQCPIVSVNGFMPPEVNCTSGVIGADGQRTAELPRDREAIETVEFTPAPQKRVIPAD